MTTSKLNSDAPASVDRLGFESHASRFARVVADYVGFGSGDRPLRPGMVFSIEGEWGAGKSTYINLVKQRLKAHVENEELVIVSFDPWWLLQKQDLILSFFRSLVGALPQSQKQEVAAAMSHLATVSKNIPDWVIDLTADEEGKLTRLGRFLRGVKESGGSLESWLATGVSPRAARDKVGESLAKAKRGLVVFVDDLDRLEGEHALAVLRFVKSIGDLSGVIYVLAYSPVDLHNSLEDAGISKPEQFLEKIVQTSVPLPPPAKWRMRALILDTLAGVLDVPAEELAANPRIQAVLLDSIAKPRDLARLSNNIAILLDQVRGEVDLIDFACVHALRTLDPTLCGAIRANKSSLTNSVSGATSLAAEVAEFMDDKTKFRERRREALLLVGDDGKKREQVLRALFPNCSAWDDKPSTEQMAALQSRRSVAIASFFDTYFSLEVSPDVMSRADIDRLLSIEGHAALVSEIKAIGEGEHGAELIDGIIIALKNDPRNEVVDRVTLALMHALDSVAHRNKQASWELAAALAFLIADRIRNRGAVFGRPFIISAAQRDTLLASGAFAWMVSRAKGELGPQSGDISELKATFEHVTDGDDYAQFKAHFSRAMMDTANSGQLLAVPAAPRLIRVWFSWDKLSMQTWGRMAISSSTGLSQFLRAYAGYVISGDIIEAYFENLETCRVRLQAARDAGDQELKNLVDYMLERLPRAGS